jgi:uncharacterized membrane protein YhdT
MDPKKLYSDMYRFKIANREAWVGCTLAIFNMVWWYGFAYGLGSKPPEEYHYILGLPAWFFLSCIVGFLVMVILVILIVKFVLKEVPFEDEPKAMEQGEGR